MKKTIEQESTGYFTMHVINVINGIQMKRIEWLFCDIHGRIKS